MQCFEFFGQPKLNARLKNFLMGWLLVLGLKECLVECATLCIKSEVILILMMVSFEVAIYLAQFSDNDKSFTIANLLFYYAC